MTDCRTITESIKSQNSNKTGAPELVWDEATQDFKAVPAGTAKDSGKPDLTPTATDVFYS